MGRAGSQKLARDTNRRHAGAARRPRGPLAGPGEPARALEEASRSLLGPEETGPRAAERRPRTRRTSRYAPLEGAGGRRVRRRGQTPRLRRCGLQSAHARGCRPRSAGKVSLAPRPWASGSDSWECRRMAGASRGQLRASWRCRSCSGAWRRRAAVRQSRHAKSRHNGKPLWRAARRTAQRWQPGQISMLPNCQFPLRSLSAHRRLLVSAVAGR
jgi:hypothetical protein